MTKDQYIKHIEDTEHIIRPSLGGDILQWKAAQQRHHDMGCAECHKRAKTNKARKARKANAAIMDSLGLVKVKGNLGGTYWE